MPINKEDYERLLRFRSTIRRYIKFVDEGARAAGVTPQQHQLLLGIKGQEGRDWATISEIAEALQISHNSAVGLADRCESNGLVKRVPSGHDRRRVHLILTKQGEELLERLSSRNLGELRLLSNAIRLS